MSDCCKIYDRRALREANRVYRREPEPVSLVTIIVVFAAILTVIAVITH